MSLPADLLTEIDQLSYRMDSEGEPINRSQVIANLLRRALNTMIRREGGMFPVCALLSV